MFPQLECECDIFLTSLITIKSLLSFQYYEMSYGLNIEMHKQVGTVMFLTFFSSLVFHSVRGREAQEEQLIGCEPSIGNRLQTDVSPAHKQGNTIVNLYHPLYNCCDPLFFSF